MHHNAMRWLSRLRGPANGVQVSLLLLHCCPHDKSLGQLRRLCLRSCLSRAFHSSHKIQTRVLPSSSESTSAPTQSPTSAQRKDVRSRGLQRALLAVIFAASAGVAYLYRQQSASPDDDVINSSTFSSFTITKREQVSPTAFIVTLRPSAWVEPEGFGSDLAGAESAGFLSPRIREAWRHGLWSVEIKQPQLQIARHYTPLPPFPVSLENGNTDGLQAIQARETELGHSQDEQTDLRILIRRMDGGEMSNYLSRQRVGDTVWLRGPHLGFDIPRRLGDGSRRDRSAEVGRTEDQRGVVFLAGGTGIAPALQIAHKLLNNRDSSGDEESQPYVSILWANRWGADALGRGKAPPIQRNSNSWFGLWGGKNTSPSTSIQNNQERLDQAPVSSLALQIQHLKRRHPSHFEISYFVDEEGSFIEAQNIEAALASTFCATGASSPSYNIDKRCTWHSSKAVELLPDDNDAARSSSPDPACACTCTPNAGVHPGVNLVCVSGPDGFIRAYAGGKRWYDGNEMQGATRGVLGRIQNNKGKKWGEWLVLKL